ncbi:MAG: hypothetical protein RR540_06595 [Oscillospiraceae bacterium]
MLFYFSPLRAARVYERVRSARASVSYCGTTCFCRYERRGFRAFTLVSLPPWAAKTLPPLAAKPHRLGRRNPPPLAAKTHRPRRRNPPSSECISHRSLDKN